MNDCISAVATAPGTGGVAIIRLSGDNALQIASKMFKPLSKIDIWFIFLSYFLIQAYKRVGNPTIFYTYVSHIVNLFIPANYSVAGTSLQHTFTIFTA